LACKERIDEVKTCDTKILAIGLLLLIVLSLSSFCFANAAFANDFTVTSAAINAAFVATYDAQKNGGNVTVLINELNAAVALVDKALTENSTNPSQALSDLQNASRIANLVSTQSASTSRDGASALEIRNSESIGSAVAIAAIAALIYIYGGRIYRRVWLYVYRNHVVKPTNG
jgi:hypothetical protein